MTNLPNSLDRAHQHALGGDFSPGLKSASSAFKPGEKDADQRLGNTAIKKQQQKLLAPVATSEFSRRLWDLQKVLWEVSDNPRFQGCHRWRAAGSNAHLVWNKSGGEKSARWGGLQTSSSVWCSPLSAAAIARTRQAQIEKALDKWTETPEHSVVFMTLTLRHKKSHNLGKLWDALSYCWRGITGTASWRGGVRMVGDKNRFGVEHFVKSVELTHGLKNGFHPHLHVVLFLNKVLSDDELAVLRNRFYERWSNAALRKGLEAPTKVRGIDVKQVVSGAESLKKLASYLAKGNVGKLSYEVADGALKIGKGDNRTMFQVLGDLGRKKTARDLFIWREYEQASTGRRQISWSKGAKDFFGVADLDDVAAELLDEKAVEKSSDYIVALVDGIEWDKIKSDVDKRLFVVEYVSHSQSLEQAVKRAGRALDLVGVGTIDLADPIEIKPKRDDDLPTHSQRFSERLRNSVLEPAEIQSGVGKQLMIV